MLEVETAQGRFLRPIRPASILPSDVSPGPGAEEATRAAAAVFGLPDFVFRSASSRHGSGQREVGDSIIVTGDRAACVQVKHRAGWSGDPATESRWLDKKIVQGARQAAGTIRALMRRGTVDLVNERGRQVTLRAGDRSWLEVIVLDHPGLEGYIPRPGPIVLLRRDWEFLFEQLKSTTAVVDYLFRATATAPVPLGGEPIRYYEFAAADHAAEPTPPDPRWVKLGMRFESTPLLPQEPIGHADTEAHVVFRLICEDVALTGEIDEWDRLDVLGVLDSVQVGYRAELGFTMLDFLAFVQDAPDDYLAWRLRSLRWPDRPLVLIGAASRFDELVEGAFRDWVSLRHQEQFELIAEYGERMTVGVLLTPRGDGLPWSTTLYAFRGDQSFHPAWRRAIEILWGRVGETSDSEPRDVDWEAYAAALAEVPDIEA